MDRTDEHILFITIIESKSFQGAATKLNISPSNVSRQLQRLEKKLGTTLLNRTTRSLSLTPQGEIYFESCKRIEEEKHATRLRMQDITASPSGRLKVTVTPAFNYAQLIAAIADFRRSYSDITFDLKVTDNHLDLVDEGIDIALRIGLLQDSRYKARKLMPSVLIPCASAEYVQLNGKPDNLNELAQHQLVATSHLQSIEKRQTELSQISLNEEQKVFLVNDVVSIYKAVHSGIGLSFLPDYLVSKDIESGTLVELLPELPRGTHDVYALFSNSEYLPLKTRLFIDFLAQRYSKISY